MNNRNITTMSIDEMKEEITSNLAGANRALDTVEKCLKRYCRKTDSRWIDQMTPEDMEEAQMFADKTADKAFEAVETCMALCDLLLSYSEEWKETLEDIGV